MQHDEVLTAAVKSANDLTFRWMETFDENQDVIGSGLGVWAVLSALLIGASGPARSELSDALALAPDDAPATTAAMRVLTDSEDSLHMGTGLWTHRSISVLESFVESCGIASVGEIPSRSVLDAWAREHTNGMIKTFPLAPSANTMMLLASAVAVDIEWKDRFRPRLGSWAAAPDAPATMLGVSTRQLDKAAVISHQGQRVSRFICASTSSIDVHLVSGDADARPGSVLGCAIRALADESLVTPASKLQVEDHAGALSVGLLPGTHDHVRVELPAFSFRQSHDLLVNPNLWGLEAACDTSSGHFGRLAKEPLAVEAGVQDALVEFNALGFKAAAVTAVRAVRGARPKQPDICRRILLDFDAPFGFLAVHRDTGLVLFSGWVATEAALTPPAA